MLRGGINDPTHPLVLMGLAEGNVEEHIIEEMRKAGAVSPGAHPRWSDPRRDQENAARADHMHIHASPTDALRRGIAYFYTEPPGR